jgi:DNA-binding MarR family transcriptional regulator
MGPPSTANDLSDALVSVLRLMRSQVDAAMTGHGLSLARGRLLGTIAAHGPARPGVLAARLHQSPRTLTDAVDALERDGLVLRTLDPADRRAQLVALTPKGVAARRAVDQPKQDALMAFFAVLDAEEQSALLRTLQKVIAASQTEDG